MSNSLQTLREQIRIGKPGLQSARTEHERLHNDTFGEDTLISFLKTRRAAIVGSCVLGFSVAGSMRVYLVTSYPHRNPMVVAVLSYLCPPSVLTVAFIDVHGSNAQWNILWLVIAAVNAVLYGVAGWLIWKLLWRLTQLF